MAYGEEQREGHCKEREAEGEIRQGVRRTKINSLGRAVIDIRGRATGRKEKSQRERVCHLEGIERQTWTNRA